MPDTTVADERKWWSGYLEIADQPQDDDQSRLEHRFLILAGTLMSGGGILWGSISAGAGLWRESMAPFGYVFVTVLNFAALAVWKNFDVARRVQVAASILLPFIFQWALGGFAASGGMMYWAMVGLVGSLSFDDPKTSTQLLVLFISLTIASAAFDAYDLLHVPDALGGQRLSALFIGLNFVVVSSVVFFLTLFFVRSRFDAIQKLKTKNTELAVSKGEAEEASRRADAANEARGRFLAVVSHEMRTPLNGIIGLTNLVLDTDLDNRQRDLLSQARVSAETLAAIINDVLDFSKIEAGGVTLEHIPFRLDDVLHRLTSAANTLAMKRGIEFVLRVEDVPRVLVGDPTRLGQVLLNLVSNAVKFTDDGEVLVWMTSESMADGQMELRVQVRDTGIGINADQVQRLFQPFEQADDSTTRRYGGTGLGLPICKHFVEMMGGEISIESEVGRGSTFSFSAVFGFEEDPELGVPAELGRVRALVVDDNASAREVLLGYLANFEIKADAVASGEAALEAVEHQTYGLVLADLRMPGVDGIELIRQLRVHPRTSNARLVLVTAFGARKDEEDATLAGANGFLAKPLRPSTLLDKLVRLFAGDVDSETREVDSLKRTKPTAIRGARVLVVEDNDINREILVSSLEAAGLTAEIAVDGQEGLDKATASERPYDVILMDLQMPNMDGLEATRRIRAGDQSTPIIGVTANALSDARADCIAAGMNEVVTKPIHMELLFNTMVRAIGPGFVPTESRGVLDVASTAALPALKGVDTVDGLARSGGNAELYLDLLRRFARGHADSVATIRESLTGGDRATAERVAHTLRGVSGNIGAKSVYKLASGLQRAMESGSETALETLLTELDDVLGSLVATIATVIAEGAPAAAIGSIAESDVQRLGSLIRDSDIEALELFETLRSGLEVRWGAETVDALKEALDGFDFDRAEHVWQRGGA